MHEIHKNPNKIILNNGRNLNYGKKSSTSLIGTYKHLFNLKTQTLRGKRIYF